MRKDRMSYHDIEDIEKNKKTWGRYSVVIHVITVAIILAAAFIALVHAGVIPRFWEGSVKNEAEESGGDNADDADAGNQAAAPETQPEGGSVADAGADSAADRQNDAGNAGAGVQGTPDDRQDIGSVPEDSTEASAGVDGQDALASDQGGQVSESPRTPAQILEDYLADDPRTPVEAKGIYVTGPISGTQKTMPKLAKMVEDTALNAMVIDVKNDAGEVTYKMGLPLAEEIGAETRYVSDMPGLISSLKEKGIYLIARIVAFKDPILAEQKPEYAVKNPDGSVFHDNQGMPWVNPYKEEVWDYLIDLSKQVASLGFDEIQYDYIRFSTGDGIADADFGEDAEGKDKCDAINGFLTKAYETLAPMGVYVSADVFGTIICNKSDGELIGQDYVEMAKHCDYICPMMYPSHYVNNAYGIAVPDADPYALINAAAADGEEVLAAAGKADPDAHLAKQRIWMQAFTATWVDGHISYEEKQLSDQIRGAADAGVKEWFLWNASNEYDYVGGAKLE